MANGFGKEEKAKDSGRSTGRRDSEHRKRPRATEQRWQPGVQYCRMVEAGLAGQLRVEALVDHSPAPTMRIVNIMLTPAPRMGNESERLSVSLRTEQWLPGCGRLVIAIFLCHHQSEFAVGDPWSKTSSVGTPRMKVPLDGAGT
jgi:hypothetical protein